MRATLKLALAAIFAASGLTGIATTANAEVANSQVTTYNQAVITSEGVYDEQGRLIAVVFKYETVCTTGPDGLPDCEL